jgi:hypothetical protein
MRFLVSDWSTPGEVLGPAEFEELVQANYILVADET